MFAAEFEPAQRKGGRRSPRAPLLLNAALRSEAAGPDDQDMGGLGRALCKVIDVSLHGARLSTYTALVRGTTIRLTLPRIGQITADVRWADDFTAGCQFQKALTQRQLDDLFADPA